MADTMHINAPKKITRLGWLQLDVQETTEEILSNGDSPYRDQLNDITIGELCPNLFDMSQQQSQPASTVA
ncbi:hypothetical protein [Alicyclobacillus suci]|uniref:hypothetical protein n=1 Tax=Alicyclobacillus suci TaxID=2816080 RepID=UPI001A8CFF58|nr:hypothetical protein [Alicyclobacillus suci]